MAALVPAVNSSNILIRNALLLMKSLARARNIRLPTVAASVKPSSVHGKVAFASTLASIDDKPNSRTPSSRKSTIHSDPNVIAIAMM